ncbi:hypothetical protein TREMEDRAFT_66369 [Tremella mesenterica DSM 1558]|uniref:uncharacterized protein n=1 Tax=Tremella mesenterica (strain ATCC 24925 / CBS 8224 / DSM 1558 / NBRC 9311 / NRRL Y-6157 / RJB 2259-6 / UBC 559-6) TaxID=578456 RepID=UPI00032D22C2|nr:uncharacterized protein TREMEDRAFT_66369 [Tremella mesenterica DSM 1558]EIW65645.1 hypothetical protein TREMEDRAFT_66369 [Tremella mesenterica DSM 1558]
MTSSVTVTCSSEGTKPSSVNMDPLSVNQSTSSNTASGRVYTADNAAINDLSPENPSHTESTLQQPNVASSSGETGLPPSKNDTESGHRRSTLADILLSRRFIPITATLWSTYTYLREYMYNSEQVSLLTHPDMAILGRTQRSLRPVHHPVSGDLLCRSAALRTCVGAMRGGSVTILHRTLKELLRSKD